MKKNLKLLFLPAADNLLRRTCSQWPGLWVAVEDRSLEYNSEPQPQKEECDRHQGGLSGL